MFFLNLVKNLNLKFYKKLQNENVDFTEDSILEAIRLKKLSQF